MILEPPYAWPPPFTTGRCEARQITFKASNINTSSNCKSHRKRVGTCDDHVPTEHSLQHLEDIFSLNHDEVRVGVLLSRSTEICRSSFFPDDS